VVAEEPVESVLQKAEVVFHAPPGVGPPAPGVAPLISQYLTAALAEEAAKASAANVERRVNLFRIGGVVWV
jgi:hypothetical protein